MSHGALGAKYIDLTLFDGTFLARNSSLNLFDGTFEAKNIGLTLFGGTLGPKNIGFGAIITIRLITGVGKIFGRGVGHQIVIETRPVVSYTPIPFSAPKTLKNVTSDFF